MLEVKSLSVRCGALDIVKGVSFAVNDGEWLMIAGPNGALPMPPRSCPHPVWLN